ncbi:MAG: PIN domain-containing protein [Deltaproteobacteria bacterium]|nr:PIN domain-containing protein [Deltaproteobacteria bacterium]
MPKRHLGTGRGHAAPPVVFVDSSAWIALFSARDRHHDEVDRVFRVAVADSVRLVTTSLVLSEVHRFQLFHSGIAAAARALDAIDASRLVRVAFPDAEHHAGARRWLAKFPDQPISYVDAVSFAFMEAERLRAALTLDQDFTIAGFDLWQRAQ